MKIEYARKMTEQEVSKFFDGINRNQNQLAISSDYITSNFSDMLLEAYHKKEKEIQEQEKICVLEYKEEMKAFQNDTCTCGSQLRWMEDFDFYGCTNYHDKTKRHRNFRAQKQSSEHYRPLYRFPAITKKYLLEILQENNLRGKLNQKRLLQFYCQQGLQDLRWVYGNKSAFDIIDNFKNANAVAKEFEKKCFNELLVCYPKCFLQFPIKYKIKDDRERFCFIDILCSNEREVVIYECKTNEWDVRDEQDDLYLALINYMTTDGRKVRLEHLIMNKNG